jgi:hypothetical protein
VRVLLSVHDDVRRARLVAREGESNARDWWARWESAEDQYFAHVMPPEAFDLVLGAPTADLS